MDADKLRQLRRAFSEIAKGYSLTNYGGDRVYIKHLSHHDQVNFDAVYEDYLEYGKKKGLPSRKERLDYLMNEEGSWTEDDQKLLDDKKKHIEMLQQNKSLSTLKNQVQTINKEISKAQIEYAQKASILEALLGMTRESFADRKLQECYILNSFYKDEALRNVYFSEDKTEYLGDSDISSIVILYNSVSERFSEKSIRLIAIQDFFQSIWGLANDDAHIFYGLPICSLSFYQIRLAQYARYFRNILHNGSTFPEDVREDPDKLEDYVTASTNAKKQINKHKDGSAISLTGATKEDYESMGINSSNSTTLGSELKKSGKKSLSMQDMMKFMNG